MDDRNCLYKPTMATVARPPPPIYEQLQIVKKVMSYLKLRKGVNVSVSNIELDCLFLWKPFLYVEGRDSDYESDDGSSGTVPFHVHADPYFAEVWTHQVSTSLNAFFHTLPLHLSCLPGLHASQMPFVLNSQLAQMKYRLTSSLVPVIVGSARNVSVDALKETFESLKRELSIESILAMKHLLQQQASALRGLKAVFECIIKQQPFTHVFFMNTDAFHSLAIYPPAPLLELLQLHGANWEEIAEFLRSGTRHGMRGASALEPNGAAKELGVFVWVRRNQMIFKDPKYDQLIEHLQAASLEAVSSQHWNGIEFVHASQVAETRTAVLPLTELSHVHGTKDVWIRSCDSSSSSSSSFHGINCGILATRLFFVLEQLIEKEILRVRYLKSELLTSAACRWRLKAKMALAEFAPASSVREEDENEGGGEEEEEEEEKDATEPSKTANAGNAGDEGVVVVDEEEEDKEHQRILADPSEEEYLNEDLEFESTRELALPLHANSSTWISMDPEKNALNSSNSSSNSSSNCSSNHPNHPNLHPLQQLSSQHVGVPIALERDYAILQHIQQKLKDTWDEHRQNLVGVFVIEFKTLAERLILYSSHLQAGSTTVALQWVAQTVMKIIKYMLENQQDDSNPCILQTYKRRDKWNHIPTPRPASASIWGWKSDLEHLRNDIATLLSHMQSTPAFEKRWFCSRHALGRSKRTMFERKHGAANSVSDFSALFDRDGEEATGG